MSDSTVVTTVGPPLGYVVGIASDSGLRLPSFADVYDTAAEAAAEIERVGSMFRTAPGSRFVVLEVREAGP